MDAPCVVRTGVIIPEEQWQPRTMPSKARKLKRHSPSGVSDPEAKPTNSNRQHLQTASKASQHQSAGAEGAPMQQALRYSIHQQTSNEPGKVQSDHKTQANVKKKTSGGNALSRPKSSHCTCTIFLLSRSADTRTGRLARVGLPLVN